MLTDDQLAAMSDGELGQYLTTLSDEQLSDVIDQLEAIEIISKQRQIDMGTSALWYVTVLRFPVFPIKPRGKQPLTRHGFKDATTDPDRITDWWQTWPDANIGIPTGISGCGYDILDVDGATGMQDWAGIKHADCPPDCSAETFCPAPGPFQIHARAWTPGDGVDRGPGRHLYIPATGSGNTTRIHGLSIDLRGEGGYVVAPPSVGLSGVRYAWLTRPPIPTGTDQPDSVA